MLCSSSFIIQAHVMKRSVFLMLVFVSGRHSGTDQIFHRSLLLIITKRHYKIIDWSNKKKPEQEWWVCLFTCTRLSHIYLESVSFIYDEWNRKARHSLEKKLLYRKEAERALWAFQNFLRSHHGWFVLYGFVLFLRGDCWIAGKKGLGLSLWEFNFKSFSIKSIWK